MIISKNLEYNLKHCSFDAESQKDSKAKNTLNLNKN